MKKYWIIGLIAGVSCGDAETGSHIGNPVSLAFTIFSALSSDSGETIIRDEKNTDYTLVAAKMYVSEIRLGLPTSVTCGSLDGASLVGATCGLNDDVPAQEEILVSGPFVVSLTEPATSPLADVRVPSLAYTRVKYRIEVADPEDGVVTATDPLADLSFIVDATFLKENISNTLHLALKLDQDIEIRNSTGIELGQNGGISIKLDASNWLANAGLGTCLEDGSIVIENQEVTVDEDTECGDIENMLKLSIESSAEVSESDTEDTSSLDEPG